MKQWMIAFLFIGIWLLDSPPIQATESLQLLIDETPENSTLTLDNKTYEGNIVITKPITIIGKKGTIIRGDGTHNVITLETSDATLKNITIEHSGMSRSSKEEYSGIRVIGNNNVLDNLTIRDIFHGIYLNRSKNTIIRRVHITGQGADKLGNQGNGIHMMRSGENTVEDSWIMKTRDGIYVEYSHHNKINRNTVTDARYGLHYMYSNENEFHDNRFIRNVGGAAIMHSDLILLENNQFSFNQGSRSFGLLIQTSRDIHVLNNEFHLNQRGLYLEQSSNNLIEANEFFHNHIGVELWASSTAHVFIKNTFNKNLNDVITIGGISVNEWHRAGVGNYWNKPLLDLNQDGIGDVPYASTSSIHQLLENNELAYLFLNSPAIAIYEKMNALLSKQKVMAEDLHPLVGEQKTSHSTLLFVTAGAILVILFFKRRKV